MNARARGLAKGAVLLGMIGGFALIPGVATAGSDSPTPYTVTAEGITLPAGTVFPAHGHVNWRTTSSSGGIHFDPNNNQPGGAYIGASFLPITLAPGECITWVQISLFDQHYGEGGQDPICKPTTTPTEEPTWHSPDPTPAPTAETPPSSEPEPSQPPAETETPTEPSPTSPETTPSEPTENSPAPKPDSTSPSVTPDPTDTPTTPTPIQPEETDPWTPTSSASSWPTETKPSAELAVTPPSSERSSAGKPETSASSPSTTTTRPTSSLAVTGSNDPLVGVVTSLVVVILGLFLVTRARSRR